MPDFSRGPGQTVDVPATGSGIPLTLGDGDGVLSVDFTLNYDPALLSVTGISLSDSLPLGWGSAVNFNTPGEAVVTIYGATPLGLGQITLGAITAVVPDDASYKNAAVLSIDSVQLNDGAILAEADSAVQVVSYFGDATGNYRYSGLDAAYIARVSVGLDRGFAAFRMKDPAIVADATGNGALSGLDAAYVARKSVGLPQEQIPDLPGTMLQIVPGGVDPIVAVGVKDSASPGGEVVLPVTIGPGSPTETTEGLLGFNLTIHYDSQYLARCQLGRGPWLGASRLVARSPQRERGYRSNRVGRLCLHSSGRRVGGDVQHHLPRRRKCPRRLGIGGERDRRIAGRPNGDDARRRVDHGWRRRPPGRGP